MFTGIVEEVGRIRALTPAEGGARIEIDADRVLSDARRGASIAVDGCCLTVVGRGDTWWAADVVAETLGRTTLGSRRVGDRVNLERPLRLDERLGGHLVQGHVDGVGRVRELLALPDSSSRVRVDAPLALLRYVAEKGSIALDGISLTVTAVHDAPDAGFEVAAVPHTLAATSLGGRRPGDAVNLEVDIVAKYVERLLEPVTGRPASP